MCFHSCPGSKHCLIADILFHRFCWQPRSRLLVWEHIEVFAIASYEVHTLKACWNVVEPWCPIQFMCPCTSLVSIEFYEILTFLLLWGQNCSRKVPIKPMKTCIPQMDFMHWEGVNIIDEEHYFWKVEMVNTLGLGVLCLDCMKKQNIELVNKQGCHT